MPKKNTKLNLIKLNHSDIYLLSDLSKMETFSTYNNPKDIIDYLCQFGIYPIKLSGPYTDTLVFLKSNIDKYIEEQQN